MNKQLLPMLFLLMLFSNNSYSMTADELLKTCENDTLVFNSKGEKVGNKIGGMCVGYLTGVLDTLSAIDKNICIKASSDTSANYLLSVLKTYISEKGTETTAQETLILAYKRAFTCK